MNTTEKTLAGETLKSYKRDFQNHVKWMKENNVKPVKSGAHVVQYLELLKEGHPNGKPKSGPTLRRYFNAIRHGYVEAGKPVNFESAQTFIKEATRKPRKFKGNVDA